MRAFAENWIRLLLQRFGYDVVPSGACELTAEIAKVVRRVAPFTMTSPQRIAALCGGVEYVARHDIPGDVVECGVWKGGSMMAVALTLLRLKSTDRTLHLLDTFEGMSEPGEIDRDCQGQVAANLMRSADKETDWAWAYGPLEKVQEAMRSVGYPEHKTVYVKGKVEDTLPDAAPEKIALLRLDTDWYESTYHELVHLYPRLSVGGVLILDDYGHWEGARRAVDQYLQEHNLRLWLNRIDYTGRIAVKVDA